MLLMLLVVDEMVMAHANATHPAASADPAAASAQARFSGSVT